MIAGSSLSDEALDKLKEIGRAILAVDEEDVDEMTYREITDDDDGCDVEET